MKSDIKFNLKQNDDIIEVLQIWWWKDLVKHQLFYGVLKL